MGLGVALTGPCGVALPVLVLDWAWRSFKAFSRLRRHNQTANKIVSKNSSAFKGCVPE
jgi:hypothetical protein